MRIGSVLIQIFRDLNMSKIEKKKFRINIDRGIACNFGLHG